VLNDRARGLWADILGELAPELTQAIGARGNHVPCPVHGGKDGFRVFNDFLETGGGVCNTCGIFRNGVKLLAWLKSFSEKQAVMAIYRYLDGNWPSLDVRPVRKLVFQDKVDPSKALASIKKIWDGCVPISGTLAETYLKNRGIPVESISRRLLFHPSLDYLHRVDGKFKKIGAYPAMVAAIQIPNDKCVCLHRTYLSEKGAKADVAGSAKKMTMRSSPSRGGGIRLFTGHDGILAVAEGIETALAVRAGTGLPVWAAVSATLMENMEMPEGTHSLHIFADKDANGCGAKAAEKLLLKALKAGVKATIHIPTLPVPAGSKGVDWLDVWNKQGRNGFPRSVLSIRRR